MYSAHIGDRLVFNEIFSTIALFCWPTLFFIGGESQSARENYGPLVGKLINLVN